MNSAERIYSTILGHKQELEKLQTIKALARDFQKSSIKKLNKAIEIKESKVSILYQEKLPDKIPLIDLLQKIAALIGVSLSSFTITASPINTVISEYCNNMALRFRLHLAQNNFACYFDISIPIDNKEDYDDWGLFLNSSFELTNNLGTVLFDLKDYEIELTYGDLFNTTNSDIVYTAVDKIILNKAYKRILSKNQ